MIGKILQWGNSVGIRMSKAELERQGFHVGQEVVVKIAAKPGEKIDLSKMVTFDLGGDLSVRHDEVDWA